MPRAIWTGSLGFGLVNLPVELHTATEDHDVRFHQLREGTGSRIRYRRGGRGPYALLRTTLEQAGKVGIARVVLRNKQHLAAVRPRADALVPETMYFADEVPAAERIEGIDPDARPEVGERDISGRSTMTEDELVDALQEAS